MFSCYFNIIMSVQNFSSMDDDTLLSAWIKLRTSVKRYSKNEIRTRWNERWVLQSYATVIDLNKVKPFLPPGSNHYAILLYMSEIKKCKFLHVKTSLSTMELLALCSVYLRCRLPGGQRMKDRSQPSCLFFEDYQTATLKVHGNKIFLCVGEIRPEDHFENTMVGCKQFKMR